MRLPYGELAKLGSSLHFASLRMTDNCLFMEEVVGGADANHLPPPKTL